jgi:hypothetical protein
MQYWDTRSRIGAIAALGGALLATLAVLSGGTLARIGVAVMAVAVAFFALPGALQSGSCPSCHASNRQQRIEYGTSTVSPLSLTEEAPRKDLLLVRRGWSVVTPVKAVCRRCGVIHSWEQTRFIPLAQAQDERSARLLAEHDLGTVRTTSSAAD